MQNPSDLYRFDTEVRSAHSGVLLVALGGFIDAGKVQHILSDHLVSTCDAEPVVTFDIDQLYDYRSRRPPMVFDANRYDAYETPTMLLRRLQDRDGDTYFLLTGPEPDFQWERLAASIRGLVEQLGVKLVVSVHGIPMGVPHTRPIGLTAHATNSELIADVFSPFGRVEVPGSMAALLELRLGEAGHDAAGFAIHVPHYLATSDFAQGALTALNAVVDLTGLNLPNDALIARAEKGRRAIASEVEGSEEVQALVSALEEQYDAFMRGQQTPNLLVPEEPDLPSADQLAAEFENFLRTVADEETD